MQTVRDTDTRRPPQGQGYLGAPRGDKDTQAPPAGSMTDTRAPWLIFARFLLRWLLVHGPAIAFEKN